MKVLFAAGHVLGAKVYMGYNEDQNMYDLARRKARYAQDKYEVETATFYVTNTSYDAVQDACTGCDIASFEHSNADDSIDEGMKEPNRVVVFRTISNPGDGPCLLIGQACSKVLNVAPYLVAHRYNSKGGEYYGVLGRAMKAGCDDAYLIEHGFHTHPITRSMLSDPDVRQQLAEAEVDQMAIYYGWKGMDEDMLQRGDKNEFVGSWQRALMEWDSGAVPQYKDDNSFGPETVEWTNKFKASMGMAEDGIVDTPTWAVMTDYIRVNCVDSGITQEQLDAEKARADKAEADLQVCKDDLAGCQTVVAEQSKDLEGVAVSLQTLDLTKQKYGATSW
jgi:hypothetical protein